MIIHISDSIRIHGTETCYQLERKRKAGDWRPFKYYTKFADACIAACEREFVKRKKIEYEFTMIERLEIRQGIQRSEIGR